MAASPTKPAELQPAPVHGRAMTRCECAEMPFAEIARRLREEGMDLRDVAQRTGCGLTCTACLPDLETYLSSRPSG
jgi:hypothetical protein